MYSVREKEAVCTTKLQCIPASSGISDFQKLLFGLVVFRLGFFSWGRTRPELVCLICDLFWLVLLLEMIRAVKSMRPCERIYCHSELVPRLLWDFRCRFLHTTLKAVQPQEGRGLISLYTNLCAGHNYFSASCSTGRETCRAIGGLQPTGENMCMWGVAGDARMHREVVEEDNST